MAIDEQTLRDRLAALRDAEPAADPAAARAAVHRRAQASGQRQLAAVAAAVVVLLGAVVAAATVARRGDDRQGVTHSGPQELPRLVPTSDQFVIRSFTPIDDDPVLQPMPGMDGEIVVYSAAGADLGAEPTVAAIVVRSEGPNTMTEGEVEPWVGDLRVTGRNLARNHVVSVAGRGVGDDELVRLLDTVQVSPDGLHIAAFSPPAGMTKATTFRALHLGARLLTSGTPTNGYEVLLEAGGSSGANGSAMLSVQGGLPEAAAFLRWQFGLRLSGTVRGHPSYAGSLPSPVFLGGPNRPPSGGTEGTAAGSVPGNPTTVVEPQSSATSPVLVWEEGPGTVLWLEGSVGLPSDDLRRLADSFQDGSDATWSSVVAVTTTLPPPPEGCSRNRGTMVCRFTSVGSAVPVTGAVGPPATKG